MNLKQKFNTANKKIHSKLNSKSMTQTQKKIRINNSMQKTNANPHAKEKQSTENPRKAPTPHRSHASPYRTASPETTTQCFTTCQFTLNSAMLTHNSPQKNISLLFFKSHAHAQCISTLLNNSTISHNSQQNAIDSSTKLLASNL